MRTIIFFTRFLSSFLCRPFFNCTSIRCSVFFFDEWKLFRGVLFSFGFYYFFTRRGVNYAIFSPPCTWLIPQVIILWNGLRKTGTEWGHLYVILALLRWKFSNLISVLLLGIFFRCSEYTGECWSEKRTENTRRELANEDIHILQIRNEGSRLVASALFFLLSSRKVNLPR